MTNHPAEKENPLISRVGVVNWDCSLPMDTFFGRYAARSLSPAKYRDRTPYYAHRTAPDQIEYHTRTVAEYETEMRYAIEAGIDYFAYCWYDSEPKSEHLVDDMAATVDAHVAELVYARRLHLQSPLREQLHYCAILITSHPYSDTELQELIRTMNDPGYEKIDGRPLVWLFPGKWRDLIVRLRQLCREAGQPEPYAVLLTSCSELTPDDADIVQAVCAYACLAETSTWEDFNAANIAQNEDRLRYGWPCVPHFSVGWDPGPRVLNPVPWVAYPEGPYAPPCTREQLLTGAQRFKDWVSRNRSQCVPGHVLVFAWNEFEEGAWICPSLGADDRPDFSRRDAFADAVSLWRSC